MRRRLQMKPTPLILKTGHLVRAKASELHRVAETAARKEKARRAAVIAPLRKAAAKAKTKVRTRTKEEEGASPQVLTEKERDMAHTMARVKETGEACPKHPSHYTVSTVGKDVK